MTPTGKGEADNVCKDNENRKKRYNRINRCNSKIACSYAIKVKQKTGTKTTNS